MKLYNLLKHKIEIEKKSLLDAVNSGEKIGITVDGDIVKANGGELPPQLYVYAGKPASLTGSAVSGPTPLTKVLGENYELLDEGERVVLSADKAWEDIVAANSPFYLYLDVTGEGISEFSDKELENLVWYSCEFGINYREIAEFLEESLEESVDGTILCIEHEEPYRFNGCAYVDDIEEARRKAFELQSPRFAKR